MLGGDPKVLTLSTEPESTSMRRVIGKSDDLFSPSPVLAELKGLDLPSASMVNRRVRGMGLHSAPLNRRSATS